MLIMSCNIRCSCAHDGPNGWPYRKNLCAHVLRARAPEIICFQEMQQDQCYDLSGLLPDYQAFAMTDTPGGTHPVNCIFYRRAAYTCISAGGYWLSLTPHVAGSKAWDSACVRLANWLQLEDAAINTTFRIVNTHLDHVSQVAREHQATLIVEDAQAYPSDYPQILTGDLNCDATNRAIAIVKKGGWTDTYGAIHGTAEPGHTYHAFLGAQAADTTGKMDWIFMRGRGQIRAAEIIRDSVAGRFPSDHYFVSATLDLGRMP